MKGLYLVFVTTWMQEWLLDSQNTPWEKPADVLKWRYVFILINESLNFSARSSFKSFELVFIHSTLLFFRMINGFEVISVFMKYMFFSCGATAQRRPGPPPPWGFEITHYDTSQSVGLLWTSDRPFAKTATLQHTTLTTDWHPCSRRDSNSQTQQAICLRLSP